MKITIRIPFSVLSAALCLAAVPTTFVPNTAEACGMYEPEPVGSPSEMLVRAYQEAESGNSYQTNRLARAVAGNDEATPNEKAQAWTIQGWMRWRGGTKDSARAAFEEAKKLDPAALEFALTRLDAAAEGTVASTRKSGKTSRKTDAKTSPKLAAEIRAELDA